MRALASLELAEKDKLQVLKRLDQFRTWRSLDEKRYCLACSKIINGEQIQVIGGARGTGPLRIICPTPDCHSIPMDWVLPTDEVLVQMSASATSYHELPAAKSRHDNGQSGRSIIGDQT